MQVRVCFAGIINFVLLIAFGLTNCSLGQEKPNYKKRLELFRQAVSDSQSESLNSLSDPKLADMIAIAERAEARIYTKNDSELRRIARDLDAKIGELLTSDIGKWMATKPVLVALFLKFDGDSLYLSDQSLNARRDRLKASAQALREYIPEIQGEFDPSTSAPTLAILEDANWVEETYKQLSGRFETLKKYEAEFPEGTDVSSLPTMQLAKAAAIAKLLEETAEAERKARERAAKENADRIADSVFERETKKTQTQLAGDERLAALDRQFMEAEFGVAEKERLKGIESAKLKEREIGDEINTMKAKSGDERLVEYLTSDRVVQLLSPFCSKGLAEATGGNGGFKRIEGLEEGPMSLRKIASCGTLAADHRSMARLIDVANSGTNDRPSWPVDKNNYANAEKNFQNMDGDMCNPYIEAQRLLRECGSKLVELKMLNK